MPATSTGSPPTTTPIASPTLVPSTVAPSTVAPLPVSPATTAPPTFKPATSTGSPPTSTPIASPTLVPSTVAPSTVAPLPVSPATTAPPTFIPATSTGSPPTSTPIVSPTLVPSTVAPSTVAPLPVSPATTAPPTLMPVASTGSPPTSVPTSSSTLSPPTAAPSTAFPSSAAPPTFSPVASSSAPPTSSPMVSASTVAPQTASPSTAVPVTTAPGTAAPTTGFTFAPAVPPTGAPPAVFTFAPPSAVTMAPPVLPTLAPSPIVTFAPAVPPTGAPPAVFTFAPPSVMTFAPAVPPTGAPPAVFTFAPPSVMTFAPAVPSTGAPPAGFTFAPPSVVTPVPPSPPTFAPGAPPTLSPEGPTDGRELGAAETDFEASEGWRRSPAEEIVAAGALVSLGSSVAGNALAAGRLTLLMRPCSEQDAVPFLYSPTRMDTGGAGGAYTGCVVGNTLLVFGVSVVHAALSGAVAASAPLRRLLGGNGSGANLLGAFGLLRFPAWSLVVFLVLYPGFAACGVRSMFYPAVPLQFVVGVCATGVSIVFPLVVLYVVRKVVSKGLAVFVTDPSTTRCTAWLVGSGEWLSKDGSQVVNRMGVVFMRYHAARAYFVVAECCLALALAFIDAVRPQSWTQCGHKRLAMLAAYLVYTSIVARLLPHRIPLDNALEIGASALACVSLFLLALSYYSEDPTAHWGYDFSFVAFQSAAGVALVKAVFDASGVVFVVLDGRRARLAKKVASECEEDLLADGSDDDPKYSSEMTPSVVSKGRGAGLALCSPGDDGCVSSAAGKGVALPPDSSAPADVRGKETSPVSNWSHISLVASEAASEPVRDVTPTPRAAAAAASPAAAHALPPSKARAGLLSLFSPGDSATKAGKNQAEEAVLSPSVRTPASKTSQVSSNWSHVSLADSEIFTEVVGDPTAAKRSLTPPASAPSRSKAKASLLKLFRPSAKKTPKGPTPPLRLEPDTAAAAPHSFGRGRGADLSASWSHVSLEGQTVVAEALSTLSSQRTAGLDLAASGSDLFLRQAGDPLAASVASNYSGLSLQHATPSAPDAAGSSSPMYMPRGSSLARSASAVSSGGSAGAAAPRRHHVQYAAKGGLSPSLQLDSASFTVGPPNSLVGGESLRSGSASNLNWSSRGSPAANASSPSSARAANRNRRRAASGAERQMPSLLSSPTESGCFSSASFNRQSTASSGGSAPAVKNPVASLGAVSSPASPTNPLRATPQQHQQQQQHHRMPMSIRQLSLAAPQQQQQQQQQRQGFMPSTPGTPGFGGSAGLARTQSSQQPLPALYGAGLQTGARSARGPQYGNAAGRRFRPSLHPSAPKTPTGFTSLSRTASASTPQSLALRPRAGAAAAAAPQSSSRTASASQASGESYLPI
ncbi:hypothetical protein DIPPA_08283 [Diplonema papillatum]|nr:hypothetical protein DIPPA_08283 [Diplonema papillatum]